MGSEDALGSRANLRRSPVAGVGDPDERHLEVVRVQPRGVYTRLLSVTTPRENGILFEVIESRSPRPASTSATDYLRMNLSKEVYL